MGNHINGSKRMKWKKKKQRHTNTFLIRNLRAFFHLTDLSLLYCIVIRADLVYYMGRKFQIRDQHQKMVYLHWENHCCMLMRWHCVTITCADAACTRNRSFCCLQIAWTEKKNEMVQNQMTNYSKTQFMELCIWSYGSHTFHAVCESQLVANHVHDLARSEQVCHRSELRNFSAGLNWILLTPLCCWINWSLALKQIAIFCVARCIVFYLLEMQSIRSLTLSGMESTSSGSCKLLYGRALGISPLLPRPCRCSFYRSFWLMDKYWLNLYSNHLLDVSICFYVFHNKQKNPRVCLRCILLDKMK